MIVALQIVQELPFRIVCKFKNFPAAMFAFRTSLLPHLAYSVKHPEKPKNVHVKPLHRNHGTARSPDALNSNFLVIEQLPTAVPRHDLLLVSIEVARLPANVETCSSRRDQSVAASFTNFARWASIAWFASCENGAHQNQWLLSESCLCVGFQFWYSSIHVVLRFNVGSRNRDLYLI